MSYNINKKQRKARRTKKVHKSVPWTPLIKLDMNNPNHFRADVDITTLEYDECWINNLYTVKVYYPDNPVASQFPNNKFTLLSFRSHTNSHRAHDWRHMQRMKNEICGDERTAVEIYPPMSNLVDTCNQFHLWVYPEDYELDFGYKQREVMPSTEIARELRDTHFMNAIANAALEKDLEEVKKLQSTWDRLKGDPTGTTQRTMAPGFLPPEMMKELGYEYQKEESQ